jgi:hypothetical protein
LGEYPKQESDSAHTFNDIANIKASTPKTLMFSILEAFYVDFYHMPQTSESYFSGLTLQYLPKQYQPPLPDHEYFFVFVYTGLVITAIHSRQIDIIYPCMFMLTNTLYRVEMIVTRH